MNVQEHLTTNFRRNIGPMALRFFVILCTVFVPLEEEVLSEISFFEAIRQILSILLMKSQLELTIPEISSINEEIRLIAKDRKMSVYYLMFNLFKMNYDLWICDILGTRNTQHWLINLDGPTIGSNENRIFGVPHYLRQHFLLIGVSVLAIYSARNYKFVIKISVKKTILKINTWALFVLKIIIFLKVCYIAFFSYQEMLSLIYLTVLIFHVLRLMKKASSQAANKLKMTGFAITLKWTSLIIIFSIELLKCFRFDSLQRRTSKQDSPFFTGIHQFANDLKTTGSIGNFQIVLVLVLMFLYLKNVKHGARLDFFDVHLSENMSKLYLYQSQWKKGQDIPVDTYFTKYFTRKLIRIMQIKEENLFNDIARFKPKFVRKLAKESKVMGEILEIIRKNHILQMTNKEKLKMKLYKLYKWLGNAFYYIISKYFIKIFLLIINCYSCFQFLFYTKDTQYYCILHFSLLYWNLCSMVVSDGQVMKILSFLLIFPPYILDMGQIYYIVLRKRFWDLTDEDYGKRDHKYIDEIMAPHSLKSYCFILVSVTIYIFALLLTMRTELSKDKVTRALKKRLDAVRKDSKLTLVFIRIYNFVVSRLLSAFRFFPIITAIIVAIYSVNILNSLLFSMALVFLWNPEYDRRYWMKFLMFIFFLIIIKQISNKVFPVVKFNVEFIAMIGITTIEEKALNPERSSQLCWLFILCFFASVRYKFLLKNPIKKVIAQKERMELKKNTLLNKLKRLTRFLADIYQYYMIWIYHICFNLILINDHKDLLSTLLFLIESATLIIHLILWKRGRNHDYQTLYQFWYLSFIVVVVYAFIRYLLFFLKYSTVNYILHENPAIKKVCYILVANELLNRETKITDESYVLQNYFSPLLLLTLVVITRSAFHRSLNINTKKKKEGSKKNNLRKKSKDKDKAMIELTKIKNQQQPTTQSKKVKSELEVVSEIDIDSSSEEEKNNVLIKPALGKPKSLGEALQRIISRSQKKDTTKKQPFNPKEFKKKTTIGYASKLLAFSVISKKNMIKSLKRKPTLFISAYLFYKGIYISYLTTVFLRNVNIYTVFMITVCLVNMVYLFTSLVKIAEDMQMNSLISSQMKYFSLNFLGGQKFKKKIQYPNYTERFKIIERTHTKQYYEQFLLLMEKSLFKVNRLFWGISFFPLCTFSACLWCFTFFSGERKLGDEEKTNFIYLMFTGLKSMDPNSPELKSELLGIQYMIIGLLFEYVFTSFYLECSEKIKWIPPSVVKSLLNVLNYRYKVFMFTFRKNPDKIRFKTLVTNYENLMINYNRSLKRFHKMKAQRLKDDSMMTREDLEKDLLHYIDQDQEEQLQEKEKESLRRIDSFSDSEDYQIQNMKLDRKMPSVTEEYAESAFSLFKKMMNMVSPTKKSEMTMIYLCEATTKEEMLLYLNFNKYKYYYVRILLGSLYAITRISYYPILHGLIKDINVISAITLGYLVYYSSKKKRIFIDQLKIMSWVFASILIVHTIHKYMDNVFIQKYDPKDFDGMENFWMKLMAKFDYKPKPTTPKDTSSMFQSGRLLIDQGVIGAWVTLKQYVTPIEDQEYKMLFFWFFLICLSFSLIPLILREASLNLFVIRKKKNQDFYFYKKDEKGTATLIIDYKAWKQVPLKITNALYKHGFRETLEIHSIFTLTLLFIGQAESDSLLLVLVLLITLIISIFEHFRRSSKRKRGDKEIALKKLRDNKRNYLYKFLHYFYVRMYWIMLIFYHCLKLIANILRMDVKIADSFRFQFMAIILLIFSSIVSDFTAVDSFFEIRDNIKRESDIKRSYASLCHAYKFNEKKIYKRIVDIISKMCLDRMTEDLLKYKEKKDIMIDFDYMNQDITNIMRGRTILIRKKYLGTAKTFFLNALRDVYKFLLDKSDNYAYKDLLYLYNVVKIRNNEIANQRNLNLEDYFDHEFEFFQSELKEIYLGYDLLRDYDLKKVGEYTECLERVLEKEIDEDALDIRMDENHLNVINMNYAKMRRLLDFRNLDKSHIHFHQGDQIDEDKMEEDLISASNILFEVITKEKNVGTKATLETFEMEFKKKGVVKCKYGQLNVIFYNISNNQLMKTYGFNVFSLKIFIVYLIRALKSNLEFFSAISIIIIHIFYGGIINIIFVGVILFLIFVEEYQGKSFWWKILYILYLIVNLFKNSVLLAKDGSGRVDKVEFFLGSTGSSWMIIGPVVMVMFLIENLKKTGFSRKSISWFENPGGAIARLVINDDVERMLDRICDNQDKQAEQDTEHLIALTQNKLNKAKHADLKLEVMKWLINNYSMIKDFKKKAHVSFRKVIRLMKNEVFRIKNEDLSNFYYRNFSYRMRKFGVNYYLWVNLTLVCIIGYILIFFPMFDTVERKPAAFLVENNVTTITVINFAVYLFFISIEYMFHTSQGNDMLGLRSMPETQKILSSYDFGIRFEKATKAIDIFRQAAVKIKSLMILAKAAKVKVKETYNSNPLLFQYWYLLCVFFYTNFTVFFWISGHRNPHYKKETGLNRFICTKQEKELVEAHGIKSCLPYIESTYAQIFYALNIIYIFLSIQQVRGGKLLRTTEIIDFNNIFNKIKFKTFMSIPLVREITTTFEYCVQRTCLRFTDFMLLNDMKAYLQIAKLKHLVTMKYPTGKQMSRKIRLGFMLGFVNLLILSLVIPLYIFSNTQTTSSFPITSGSLVIDLVDEFNQKIVTMFKSDKLMGNKPFDTNQGTKDQQDITALWKNEPDLNRFSNFQFYRISMNKYSDQYLDVTPKLTEMLNEQLTTGRILPTVHVNLTFTTPDNKFPWSSWIHDKKLDTNQINQLVAIFSSGCQPPEKERNSEMFLAVLPTILELKKDKIVLHESDLKKPVKFGLSIKCAPNKRNYMYLPSDKKNIDLIVISKVQNENLSLLSKFLSSSILNLKNMYVIIVVYIGMNLFRNIMFGQTVKIWHTAIPRPDIFLLIMDAINYARQDQDLLKEEMLFLMLIDAMRNPEMLREMSDSVLSTRKDLFNRQLKRTLE